MYASPALADSRRDLRRAGAPSGLRYALRHDITSGLPVGAEAVPGCRRARLEPDDGQAAALLRHACAAAATWPRAGVGFSSGFSVSVGIAPRLIQDGSLPGAVAEALDRSGLEAERLELLLTDPGTPADPERQLLMLAALRDLGVGLMLDDFGAELGNLSTLRRLPLTGLKLARRLVRGLPGDREDAAIAHAASATARALGLVVVADGVDSDTQLAFLANCGCHAAQGALFGGLVPAGAVGASI